jgi:hypothetical protein
MARMAKRQLRIETRNAFSPPCGAAIDVLHEVMPERPSHVQEHGRCLIHQP